MSENMNQNNNQETINELAKAVPSVAKVCEKTGDQKPLNELLSIIRTMSMATNASNVPPTAKGKYFYARVLTLRTGEKHYHPMVGGIMNPSDIIKPEAYKMLAKDNILDLQNDWMASTQKKMAEAKGYKIQAVYVTLEVYENLEKQLLDLMTSIIEGLDYNLDKIIELFHKLDGSFVKEELLEVVLKEVTKRSFTSGSAVDKDGNIVDKSEYIDEAVEVTLERNYPEDCDHDCESCDDYSEDCERCCRTCDCGEMGMCGCGL